MKISSQLVTTVSTSNIGPYSSHKALQTAATYTHIHSRYALEFGEQPGENHAQCVPPRVKISFEKAAIHHHIDTGLPIHRVLVGKQAKNFSKTTDTRRTSGVRTSSGVEPTSGRSRLRLFQKLSKSWF